MCVAATPAGLTESQKGDLCERRLTLRIILFGRGDEGSALPDSRHQVASADRRRGGGGEFNADERGWKAHRKGLLTSAGLKARL